MTYLMTSSSIVPTDTREAVRELFSIDEAKTLGEITKEELFQTLKDEFLEAAEGLILDPIVVEDYFDAETLPKKLDVLKLILDYVDQRERLKDPLYRKETIEIALNFKPVHAGIPQANMVKGTKKKYLQDWQKRMLALILRGVTEYPCSVAFTTLEELSEDFNSQFRRKDNIKAYDKFKSELSAGSEKHWAMQNCFDRLGCTVYPYSEPPVLSGLGDVTQSMFNSQLNHKEKNLSFDEKEFTYFVRAINIYRRVWPEYSKSRILGSWIRGCVAVISMLDKNVLKGSDEWLIEILEEAKDPKYELLKAEDNETIVGFESPTTWTSRKNWQGNRFHQNAVQSVAKVWNEIRKDKTNRKDRRIPKLDENGILGLENAKFLNIDLEN